MAKTLLNSVNETLKRVGVVSGDSGAFTSLTDSARQREIDTAVQVINEGIDELYSGDAIARPQEQAESTIMLLLDTREYTLATDLNVLRFPMVDQTNTQFIHEYPGGYNQMILDDPERDDTGLPRFGAIRPTDGKFYVDTAPQADDVGKTYTYQYDKDMSLSTQTDEVPFKDVVFRAMVPAWVQLWKRERRNEFDGALFEASIGRAARFLSQTQPRSTWFPR